ncbi:MAG: extracellular solute-binding protein [Lachnospiraceae bacterium]|nr:extracellular solute-binding protein [Lachnospiraceae bacterium]
MKKKLLLFVISSALAVILLSGCHGKKESYAFTLPEEFDTSLTYEITFWAKNDSNKAQVNVYQRAISEFQELYPNVHVTLRLYTDYSRIYNDVITNISTGTTPNVCITYPDHIATYITGDNVVVPLDGLIADKKYGLAGSELLFDGPSEAEIIPEFLAECSISGETYALPYMRSTEACYVNKTYVERLGYTLPDVLTWDFVFEVSEAAMEKDEDGLFKVNGQKVLIPFIYKSTDNMMISMLRQLDAGYSDDAGHVLIFNDETRAILKEISAHAKTGAFSTFKISSYPANFLNAGQCLFAIDSTAGATWMGSHAPLSDIAEDAYVDFETEVMLIPQYDTENPLMISQGPSVCIFNKEDPQEVLASWLFMQYLLTNSVQIPYAQTEGYVPVTKKAQESAEYRDYLSRRGEDNSTYYDVKIDATKLLLENTDKTFVTPVFNGSASLRSAAGELIENVTKSTRRKADVNDEFITKLYDDVTSLYHLDQIEVKGLLGAADDKDLGPLPKTSVILLISLAAVWAILAAVWIGRLILAKKDAQK